MPVQSLTWVCTVGVPLRVASSSASVSTSDTRMKFAPPRVEGEGRRMPAMRPDQNSRVAIDQKSPHVVRLRRPVAGRDKNDRGAMIQRHTQFRHVWMTFHPIARNAAVLVAQKRQIGCAPPAGSDTAKSNSPPRKTPGGPSGQAITCPNGAKDASVARMTGTVIWVNMFRLHCPISRHQSIAEPPFGPRHCPVVEITAWTAQEDHRRRHFFDGGNAAHRVVLSLPSVAGATGGPSPKEGYPWGRALRH